MNGVKAHKDKEIQDINVVMTEIREAYNKIQEKISQLKETSFKDAVEKYSEEASSILETLNQTDQDLQPKSLKEIEVIKNKMLIQYDKATNLQHELKRIYSKEAFIRQYSIDEECSTSRFLDRSVNYDGENTSIRSKHTPNQNYLDSPQMENHRYESEGQKRYRPSYCTSDFSDKIIHEFNEHSDGQEEGSFEDYKAYRNTIKNKRIASRHQTSQSVQFSRMPKGEFFKEPSDYEYTFSKKAKIQAINNPSNTKKEQSYIEKIWNLHGAFGKITSPKKYIDESNQTQQGFFFKNSKELLQFLDASENNQRDYLWQYVSFLQERLQTDAEYHQREVAELKEMLAYKDETIKQLLKKQEKHDISAEAKYYENLKYVHNPRKMISQIKSDRYGGRYRDNNTSFQDENMLSRTNRRGYDSNQTDRAGLTKKNLSNFDAYQKSPLMNVSINQSYDYHNNDNAFSSKTHRNQIEGYSTIGSEDDLMFSTGTNQRAYIQNLQETLTTMKENSILVQSENDKLKEYVKLLRNKVAMLEREKEQGVIKQNTSHISQHKSHNRTYTQVSQSTSNLGFKWTDPNKFLELEKRNKALLNSHRYNKSISYAPQETES